MNSTIQDTPVKKEELNFITEECAKSKLFPNFKPRKCARLGNVFNYLNYLCDFALIYEFKKSLALADKKAIDEVFYIKNFVVDVENKNFYLLKIHLKKTSEGLELLDIENGDLGRNEIDVRLRLGDDNKVFVNRIIRSTFDFDLPTPRKKRD